MSIKEVLKKNELIRELYTGLRKKVIASLIKYAPVTASKYLYKKTIGQKLNLKNPRNFNEKLQWLKLYWQHPLVSKCADKYEVREYIKQCGCEEILNELYGVYENAVKIDWDKLPKKFVLKTTNACGTNIICDDKDKLNKNESIKNLSKWLKIDYSLIYAELHYSKITPRIICEKYLETKSGFLPNDYKIYCFNGNAKLILIAFDRDKDLKLIFLDLEWNRLDIRSDAFNKGEIPKKPYSLNEMIKYAEKISKPFPFVRVDFYEYNNKPVFGEMTFTPLGCTARQYNEYGLKLLGDMIELPEKYSE